MLFSRGRLILLACVVAFGAMGASSPAQANDVASSQRLETLWRDVLSASARPATWRARRETYALMAADPELTSADREGLASSQIDSLENEIRDAGAIPRVIDAGRKGCIGKVLRNCKIVRAGALRVPGGNDIRWQIQSGFTPSRGGQSGIVLLEQTAKGLVTLGWSYDGIDWKDPRVIQRADELLLTVPGRSGGTGSYNTDLLYRRAGSAWQEIEIESWTRDLVKRLPSGLGVWKGVDYDFVRMTATMRVWRSADANCCPSGGAATASFRIDGERLTLTDLKYEAPP